jgi:hypothetical protein
VSFRHPFCLCPYGSSGQIDKIATTFDPDYQQPLIAPAAFAIPFHMTHNTANKAPARESSPNVVSIRGNQEHWQFRCSSKCAMNGNRGLSFQVPSKLAKQPLSVAAADSTEETPASKPAPKATLWRELFSFAVEALDLRSWREANPMACIVLAGFIAIVAEPLVHGGLPGKFVALMMSLSK